jgi:hypothetical protein
MFSLSQEQQSVIAAVDWLADGRPVPSQRV